VRIFDKIVYYIYESEKEYFGRVTGTPFKEDKSYSNTRKIATKEEILGLLRLITERREIEAFKNRFNED